MPRARRHKSAEARMCGREALPWIMALAHFAPCRCTKSCPVLSLRAVPRSIQSINGAAHVSSATGNRCPEAALGTKGMDAFDVLKCLGQGAFGRALLCRDRATTELVVVKEVRCPDEDALRQASREARRPRGGATSRSRRCERLREDGASVRLPQKSIETVVVSRVGYSVERSRRRRSRRLDLPSSAATLRARAGSSVERSVGARRRLF